MSRRSRSSRDVLRRRRSWPRRFGHGADAALRVKGLEVPHPEACQRRRGHKQGDKGEPHGPGAFDTELAASSHNPQSGVVHWR